MFGLNFSDYLAVKNVLSRYCEALDLKEFELLKTVFTPEAVADYPFNSDLQGVEAISNAIKNRLGPIRTHHSLTTQIITFHPDGKGATAATHFVGVHFGQGPHEGKMVSAYGGTWTSSSSYQQKGTSKACQARAEFGELRNAK